MKCFCGHKAKKTSLEVKAFNISIGRFRGFRCGNCGEEWFEENEVKEIEKKSKKSRFVWLSQNRKCSCCWQFFDCQNTKTVS